MEAQERLNTSEKDIAQILLTCKAVELRPSDPFRFSSGILSPIYTDNRKLISRPKERRKIVHQYVTVIKSSFPDTNCVAGTATAGIPWAAWIAEELNLPMVYVRSSAKSHGKQNQIEGDLTGSTHVVIIEDLISTGGSALTVAKALRKTKVKTVGVVGIFQYCLPIATAAFRKSRLNLIALTNLPILLDLAQKNKAISEEERDIIVSWYADPIGWAREMGHNNA